MIRFHRLRRIYRLLVFYVNMGRISGRVFKRVKRNRIQRASAGAVKGILPQILNSSASAKKISEGILPDISSEETSSSGFRLIDIELLSEAIHNSCTCANCGSNSMKLYDDGTERIGIVSTLHVVCEECKADSKFKTSPINKWVYDANIRFCYGMRCLGVGREGANLFCGLMNMPPPVNRFTDLNTRLLISLEKVAKRNLLAAVQDAVAEKRETEPNSETPATDLSVSCDGTWMKRGHTSLHGVSTVISVATGKVLDLQVMSKYCATCSNRKKLDDAVQEQEWQAKHQLECSKNHSGSSGGMEAAGMKLIFHRSESMYGVRYTEYLGDGDSSSFKSVLDSQPYGPDCSIQKLECVGHIQKRMGGRLLKLKKELGEKKLEDGKPIGGQGRLTAKEIHKLQNYYGSAIRNNTEDVKKMQQAVWATYFHKLSTNDHPQHFLCDISWCGYKKSQADGSTFHHNSLPRAVLDVVKPTYRFLADPELLKKCAHGQTQNSNESFNRLIWLRCRKTTFISSDVLKIGAYDACIVFNSGNIGRIHVLEELGIKRGIYTTHILRSIDEARIAKADSAMDNLKKWGRQDKQTKKKELVEAEEDEEYGYGQH